MKLAKVLYDYTAAGPTEMSLVAGETIELVLHGPAGGWSKGLKGAFPTDYVEAIAAVSSVAVSTAPQSSVATAPSAQDRGESYYALKGPTIY